jgi:four helix bundle protein
MTKSKKYDLEERTAKFAEEIVEFCKSIKKNDINKSIITQLVRSGTSIGANYCEADGAESGKDFKHKISICKKESKETKYWLRIIVKSNPETKEKSRELWREAQEFTLIFSAILLSEKNQKPKI